MVPKKEAVLVIPMAKFALPCRAKGYPSRAVAAADPVPGIFRRIAVIEPP